MLIHPYNTLIDKFGTPDEIRTHTLGILSPLTLPIGLRERYLIHSFLKSLAMQQPLHITNAIVAVAVMPAIPINNSVIPSIIILLHPPCNFYIPNLVLYIQDIQYYKFHELCEYV